MNWFLVIVYVLPYMLPFLPWAQQVMQKARPVQQVVQMQQVVQPVPAEAGQPGVVFHEGRWWKWDGSQWWLWTPAPVYMAHN